MREEPWRPVKRVQAIDKQWAAGRALALVGASLRSLRSRGSVSYLYTVPSPKQVTIAIDGEEPSITSTCPARTVGQPSRRAGIALRGGRRVEPALTRPWWTGRASRSPRDVE